MANFSVDGLEGLMADLEALEHETDSLVEETLNEGADILVRAQQEEIRNMWSGRYSEGISAKSIKKGKVTTTKNGKKIVVSPHGSRKRGKQTIRNAEIAFLNEYGSSGKGRTSSHKKRSTPKIIAPRPAIRTANLKAESAISKAAEDVLDSHLKKHGL